MLITGAAKSLKGWDRVGKSYVEISRYIHSIKSSNAPLECLPPKPVRKSGFFRCAFHSSRFINQEVSSSAANLDVLETFKKSLSFPTATHEIGDIDAVGNLLIAVAAQELGSKASKQVVLHGFLGIRHDLSKKLSFVPLLSRDLCYSVQIVSSVQHGNENAIIAHDRLRNLEQHAPVVVWGLVKTRKEASSGPAGDVKKVKSFEIELCDVQPLNEFPKDIIFTPETVFPPEQRHLQIRQDKQLRDALVFRAKAANLCREFLGNRLGFTEIETPILFKPTPEGAREFIVPTRRKGFGYALPQSPQQYKQVLMSSGVSRYFQIAKCFRDEDLRADRQPEFTQLDLEMSFASGADVMKCIEALIGKLWREILDVRLPPQLPRMTYHQAMSQFGSDKPDLRLGMPLIRIDYLLPPELVSKITPLTHPIIETLLFQLSARYSDHQSTQEFVNKFMDSPDALPFTANPDGAPGIFIYDSRKPLSGLFPFGFQAAEQVEAILKPKDGDIIILQARKDLAFSGGSTPIGNLRTALHKAAVKQGLIPFLEGFQPLWITDFPLFSPSTSSEPGQGGTAGLSSTHHPFTSPKTAADVDLLLTDPSSVTGEHYDLVMNGVELGGGSRRIHNADMQRFIMADILKMSPERISEFSHLIEVLRAGCPPHAGIALGFDRLIAVMLGKESVRDVIAFPKSGKGEDLLVKSPSVVSEDILKTYHLQLDEKD